jgi:hypothetical protein
MGVSESASECCRSTTLLVNHTVKTGIPKLSRSRPRDRQCSPPHPLGTGYIFYTEIQKETQEKKFQRKTTATAFAIHLAREKFYGTVQGTNSCKSLNGSKLNVHQNLRHPIPTPNTRYTRQELASVDRVPGRVGTGSGPSDVEVLVAPSRTTDWNCILIFFINVNWCWYMYIVLFTFLFCQHTDNSSQRNRNPATL